MGLRIGITIGLQSPGESIWVNGIKQNALMLASVLKNSERDHNVVILNTTGVPLGPELDWNLDNPKTLSMASFDGELDLLIVLGGAISQDTLNAYKRKGCKVIAYKCGSEYVQSMQATLFNRTMSGPPAYPVGFDALWLIPQVARTTASFYSVLHRSPISVVPFIWDPTYLEKTCEPLPHFGMYQPGNASKRISVFEPNIDVLKYCVYPVFATELAYRKIPERIEFLSVVNAEHIKDNKEFLGVMSHLDIVKERKAFFETRHQTAWFLSHHTDIVVSHQWDNPLNYLYLEICWLGYPLIHNADLCQNLGYYYSGFDVDAASERLMEALQSHDDGAERYLKNQRRRITPFLVSNPKNITAYDDLIDQLFK
jgi:Protein of unknown function (DUF2827)